MNLRTGLLQVFCSAQVIGLLVVRPDGAGVLYGPADSGALVPRPMSAERISEEVSWAYAATVPMSDEAPWPRRVLDFNACIDRFEFGFSSYVLALRPAGLGPMSLDALVGVAMGNSGDGKMASRVDVLASGLHDVKGRVFMVEARIQNVKRTLEQVDPTTAAACAAEMGEALRTLDGLADELHDVLSWYRLGRSDSGGLVMVPSVVSDLLEDSVQHVRGTEDAAGIDFTVNCEVDEPWILDPGLVGDSVRNMAANAVRYATRRIHLSASVDAGNGHLVIAVEDDGPGFSTQEERSTAARDRQNSGVGLLVARKVARLHRRNSAMGALRTMPSTLLGGARVALYLP